eukprot:6486217-Amphidinium_carterae.2
MSAIDCWSQLVMDQRKILMIPTIVVMVPPAKVHRGKSRRIEFSVMMSDHSVYDINTLRCADVRRVKLQEWQSASAATTQGKTWAQEVILTPQSIPRSLWSVVNVASHDYTRDEKIIEQQQVNREL